MIKIDDQGRLDFSRKALIDKPEGMLRNQKDLEEIIEIKSLSKSVDSNNFEIPTRHFIICKTFSIFLLSKL